MVKILIHLKWSDSRASPTYAICIFQGLGEDNYSSTDKGCILWSVTMIAY